MLYTGQLAIAEKVISFVLVVQSDISRTVQIKRAREPAGRRSDRQRKLDTDEYTVASWRAVVRSQQEVSEQGAMRQK